MRLIAIFTSLACVAAAAAADKWNPMEFFIAHGNPDQGDVQGNGAMWTFRRAEFNGPLLTGMRGVFIIKSGIGLWGEQDGPYGFLPCVGPRVSPDKDLDGIGAGYQNYERDFDGLLVIPTNDDDAFLVFTATEPVMVPTLTLRGEMVYGSSNGVRLTVRTRIAGQSQTWLDHGVVSKDIPGHQEWVLFQNDHPQMQKGDKLWIDVDANGDYTGDWANISLESGGCYADCTGDGSLDLFDFLCFVNAFNAGEDYSDCDGNGARDLFDFLCFVNAFNTGC